MPGKRKEFQNPGLLSLGEKEAVSLEGKPGYRPGLEDPVVMQGLSPKMETLGPLGLAVDRNGLSEYLPLLLPPSGQHSPGYIYYCLRARSHPKGFIYINSVNPHNLFLKLKITFNTTK